MKKRPLVGLWATCVCLLLTGTSALLEAQTLPSPWTTKGIGTDRGSATFASGAFTVKGAGSDIWGTNDTFRFVYRSLSGDGTIVARVASETATNTYAKAGVMMRESTSGGSATAILDMRPGGSLEFMARQSNGASMTFITGGALAFPGWLKLVRSGTTITAYTSSTGATWALVGSTTVSMASNILVGMAVTSHNSSALNTSLFDNVTVTTGSTVSQLPGTPTSPSPSTGSTDVTQPAALTWSAPLATSYDVSFGTTNPPPQVAAGLANASYSPAMADSTKYYWRVVARNSAGSTTGPVWSLQTAAPAAPTNVVVYANDIAAAGIHGAWAKSSDSTAAQGVVLGTPDIAIANTAAALATPADYVDVPFSAPAGTPYTLWIRLRALANSKYNDSAWVQFSDALANNTPVYPINSTSGLLVNLATDSTGGSLNGWGWQNTAYWLTQPTTVTFSTSGTHTLRLQVREDGLQFDQIVLSPTTYAIAAPGPVANDTTIVPKSTTSTSTAPGTPATPTPVSGATGMSTTPALTWTAVGATSYDLAFGTTNPPSMVSLGQTSASYAPAALSNSKTYFWQVTAHNTSGASIGPIWSFTTAASVAPPPATPGTPTPMTGATGVSTTPTLIWTAAGATTYDVSFGNTNPPPIVSIAQSGASYTPAALSSGMTYFWQVIAHNATGASIGPIWSFTTLTSTGGGTTWSVPAGGDFQAALDNAQPGDTILLQAGATFTGNFVLPVKSGSSYITIRTSTPDAQLPGATTRIDPSYASLLPKIQSANSATALITAPSAHHYRLQFLEFRANYQGFGDILDLGAGDSSQNTLGSVPHDLIVDRVYIHGDVTYGQKRGIGLNSASTSILNSYIAEIKSVGQDSQAICGWNGPGPYTITNNYLEAAGENVLFGGADPSIPNLIPSDITFTGNHVAKQTIWRTQAWQVKNLLELKNAQRVIVDGNVMEYNWLAAQVGFSILFTPRNQDGTAPWSIVQQVQFTNNVVRHVSAGVNILGVDDINPSQLTNNIVIRNNLFEDISSATYGGSGQFVLVGGGANITVDHNTVFNDGSSTLYAYGTPVSGFTFTNNIAPDNMWGIMGGNASPGNGTIAMYFPNGVILGGIYAGGSASVYPTGNYFPTSMSAVGFVNLAGGNYRLSSTSIYRNAATDGTDVGCNITTLNAAAKTTY